MQSWTLSGCSPWLARDVLLKNGQYLGVQDIWFLRYQLKCDFLLTVTEWPRSTNGFWPNTTADGLLPPAGMSAVTILMSRRMPPNTCHKWCPTMAYTPADPVSRAPMPPLTSRRPGGANKCQWGRRRYLATWHHQSFASVSTWLNVTPVARWPPCVTHPPLRLAMSLLVCHIGGWRGLGTLDNHHTDQTDHKPWT